MAETEKQWINFAADEIHRTECTSPLCATDYSDSTKHIEAIKAVLARHASSQREPLRDDAVLCYVYGGVAYFTTQPLDKQWGDDWDDAPYEHNAGTPYGPHGKDEHWEILELRFSGEWRTPDYGQTNSPWSVEKINKGACPWLCHDYEPIYIKAGCTMPEFAALIEKGGGEILFTRNWESRAEAAESALRAQQAPPDPLSNEYLVRQVSARVRKVLEHPNCHTCRSKLESALTQLPLPPASAETKE